jgi:hypothetical protein
VQVAEGAELPQMLLSVLVSAAVAVPQAIQLLLHFPLLLGQLALSTCEPVCVCVCM